MKLNFTKNIVDRIIEAVEQSKRRVESVELTREERAELYRSVDKRFNKIEQRGREDMRRIYGLKGYRGYISSKVGALAVLAAEEQ